MTTAFSESLTDTGSMAMDTSVSADYLVSETSFCRLYLLGASQILMIAATKLEDHCAPLDSSFNCRLPPWAPALYLGQFLPALSMPSPGLIPLITYTVEASACLAAEAMLAQMQTRISLFVSYTRRTFSLDLPLIMVGQIPEK